MDQLEGTRIDIVCFEEHTFYFDHLHFTLRAVVKYETRKWPKNGTPKQVSQGTQSCDWRNLFL